MHTKENSNCPVCRKICLDTQNCICCDNCENWFQGVVNSPVRILNFFRTQRVYTLAIIAPTTSVENVLNLFLTTTMPYVVITLAVPPGFILNVLISHSIHTTLCTIIKTLNSGSGITATFFPFKEISDQEFTLISSPADSFAELSNNLAEKTCKKYSHTAHNACPLSTGGVLVSPIMTSITFLKNS